MAYDEKLAMRIRAALADRGGVVEKKMFGGLAFMISGKMACGIIGDDLMVKVGADRFDQALKRPHTRPMDFTGKPSRGMVYVAPAGVHGSPALKKWVDEAVAVAVAAPPKKKKAKKKATRRRK